MIKAVRVQAILILSWLFQLWQVWEEGIQPSLQRSTPHIRQTQRAINTERKRFCIYNAYSDTLGKELPLLNI